MAYYIAKDNWNKGEYSACVPKIVLYAYSFLSLIHLDQQVKINESIMNCSKIQDHFPSCWGITQPNELTEVIAVVSNVLKPSTSDT